MEGVDYRRINELKLQRVKLASGKTSMEQPVSMQH